MLPNPLRSIRLLSMKGQAETTGPVSLEAMMSKRDTEDDTGRNGAPVAECL